MIYILFIIFGIINIAIGFLSYLIYNEFYKTITSSKVIIKTDEQNNIYIFNGTYVNNMLEKSELIAKISNHGQIEVL